MDNNKQCLPLSSKIVDETFVKSADEIYQKKKLGNIMKYLHYVMDEFAKTGKPKRPKSKQTNIIITKTKKGNMKSKSSLYWSQTSRPALDSMAVEFASDKFLLDRSVYNYEFWRNKQN